MRTGAQWLSDLPRYEPQVRTVRRCGYTVSDDALHLPYLMSTVYAKGAVFFYSQTQHDHASRVFFIRAAR